VVREEPSHVALSSKGGAIVAGCSSPSGLCALLLESDGRAKVHFFLNALPKKRGLVFFLAKAIALERRFYEYKNVFRTFTSNPRSASGLDCPVSAIFARQRALHPSEGPLPSQEGERVSGLVPESRGLDCLMCAMFARQRFSVLKFMVQD